MDHKVRPFTWSPGLTSVPADERRPKGRRGFTVACSRHSPNSSRMLSWVVKVVPQPPEPPPKPAEEQKEVKPAAAPPPAATAPRVSEKKVTFQDECKAEAPKEAQAAEDNGPAPGSQSGVLKWISGALPQPAVSPKLNRVDSSTKDDDTTRTGMIAWIAQGLEKVVPQPEVTRKEAAPAEPPPEVRPAAAVKAAPPQVTEEEDAEDSKPQPPSMMGWITSGIGRMLPQPVQKQDSGGDEVQNISVVQKKRDLVLEDVGQEEDEEEQKETGATRVHESTPLMMESIRTEAGEEVQAPTEDRHTQQDPLEAARIAEEMARKAAEEAVRQLEVEQSAKIVIETLPDSNEQLPNILEEEDEDEPESLVDVCPAEDADAAPSSTDVEPASERRDLESPASQTVARQPEAEGPGAATADQEQEQEQEQEQGDSEEDDAADVGCGVPDLCSPLLKSFLLRFPRAAEHLRSCRKLMHDNYLTPPKLSALTPPPELARLAQELSQLPEQARQCCMSVYSRFTRLNSTSQHPPQP